MEYFFHVKYKNKLVIMFDKQNFLNCMWQFFNSWMWQSSERETMWEVCHSDSFTGHSVHCKEDAHQTFESETKWQNGGWQDAHANCTQVAGPERLILHAQRCPVILSTSGTFLPLGQSCVYFQGAVFFPGPSWPLSEGFWQRSTLHKRPGHSSCLSLIPSVSSC